MAMAMADCRKKPSVYLLPYGEYAHSADAKCYIYITIWFVLSVALVFLISGEQLSFI